MEEMIFLHRSRRTVPFPSINFVIIHNRDQHYHYPWFKHNHLIRKSKWILIISKDAVVQHHHHRKHFRIKNGKKSKRSI